MLGNLRGGDADTAADRMDQNCLAGFEPAHHDEKLPSREIVDRDCSGFERGHARRALEYLSPGTQIDVGIAAEPRQRKDVAANPAPSHVGAGASTRPPTS